MKSEVSLRIIDLSNGHWKFDIKAKMNDEQKRILLGRIKHIEQKLNEMINTEIIPVTGNVEILRIKKERILPQEIKNIT
jgi:hypothetical protein